LGLHSRIDAAVKASISKTPERAELRADRIEFSISGNCRKTIASPMRLGVEPLALDASEASDSLWAGRHAAYPSSVLMNGGPARSPGARGVDVGAVADGKPIRCAGARIGGGVSESIASASLSR